MLTLISSFILIRWFSFANRLGSLRTLRYKKEIHRARASGMVEDGRKRERQPSSEFVIAAVDHAWPLT